MASVSVSITVDQAESESPLDWTAGTSAPGAGDFEIRVNTAKFLTSRQIDLAVQKFETFLRDSNLAQSTFAVG